MLISTHYINYVNDEGKRVNLKRWTILGGIVIKEAFITDEQVKATPFMYYGYEICNTNPAYLISKMEKKTKERIDNILRLLVKFSRSH